MSTAIDNKVVEMRFDNKQFENNVATSLSTLDKLKQKLNLTGASKGLENVDASAKKVNFNPLANAVQKVSSGFSALEVMGITALANITNSAVNAGKRIVSALTIDPIKTGFSEYETQINAVQTILANTESKGTTLQDVNRALDELNLYADKTIYNFTEMTRNIGTFTAAGVDLETSVNAIQGIANLAAVSGSTSQQASTAMYQLSQALSSGTVKLMDWNSVVNAGMGGQVFQDALKATAKVHGVNVDAMIKKNGSFRESLQEGWITSEILTETLSKFTMAAEEGSEEWENYKKSLRDQGYTEKEAENILKMANTATDAATKVKTFSQLFDTLKESAQSGWTSTWEIIVGDFGEAKEFLTQISDTLGGMISASAEARNNLLTGGLSTGWKQLLGAGIADEEGYKEELNKVAKNNGFAFDELIKETEKNGGTYEDALKKALSDGKIDADMLTKSVSNLSAKMQGMSAEERKAAGYTEEHVQQIKKLDEGLKNGTISMDEFVKKMMRPSGRENLIEALTNAFKGLMNIAKPIKEAFRDIFPAMESEELYNITVRIKEMTARFAEFTEKHAPQIKSTFKGIFAVIDIGITFIKELANGIISLLKNFKGMGTSILGITGSFGDYLSNLRDSVKQSDLFGRAIDKVVGFLQKGIDKIKEFGGPGLKGFFDFFKGIFDFLTKIGSKIGSVLGDAISEGDLLGVVNLFNSGVISAILLGVNNFVGNLSGTFENISDVLGSLKGILESYQQDLQAKTLMKIATAIGILALSITVLAMIKPEKLASAITALSVLFVELLASLAVFSKISSGLKGAFKGSAALIGLSTAILILSAAMKVMATMSWEEIGKGLVGVAGGLTALVIAVNFLPESKVKKAASAIKKLSVSLIIFGAAMKIMASMSWEEIGKGLTGTVAGLAAMVIAINLLPKNTSSRLAGVFRLSVALVILAGALKILATMSWDDIGRSLTAMGLGLMEIVAAVLLLPKDTAIRTLGLLGLATSLVILAGALKIMATMNWDEIGRSLSVMGGALLELVIALNLMKRAITGSAALVIAATGLVILAGALKIFASMSWEEIGKGLVVIAGAFIIFGAATAILGSMTPALLGVAGAFALFGVAVLAIGAGLTLAALGISALATALSLGATAIVTGLSAIILGIVQLVPQIIKTLGDSIVILCQVIIECAPMIADTILIVISKIFESLAKYTPTIISSLAEFIIALLQGLRDYLPQIIVAAVEVIGALFQGIVNAIGQVNTENLIKGIAALGLLSGLMYLLAGLTSVLPGAMLGVLALGAVIAELAIVLAAIGGLSQIPGLSWLIQEGGNFLQTIGTAIGQFIGGLVGGIALGATASLPQVGTNLSEFMTNLKPFIEGIKTVDPGIIVNVAALSGAIALLSAANLIANIASFMSLGSSLSELGLELSRFLVNATPFIMGAALIKPEMLTGVRALADTILILTAANLVEGLTSWFGGGNSLAEFGSELGALGTNMKLFATNLGTFDESQVTSINCAAQAIKALAEASANIPNEGGLWGALCGENGLATFAGYLPGLGTNLRAFVTNLGTFTDEQISTTNCAAQAIKALAEAASVIPNDGGLAGIFAGENSISAFSDKLPGLGTNLGAFITNLGTFDENKVATVDCAGKAIKALAEAAKNIPNDGGLWGAIVGDNSLATFSGYLPDLGTNLAAFITNLGTFDEGKIPTVECACEAIKALAEAAKNIPNEGGFWAKIVGDNSLAAFGDKLPDLGTNLSDFVGNLGEFTDAEVSSVYSASAAIKAIAELGNIDIKDTGKGLESFGKKMVAFAKKVKEFVSAIGETTGESIDGAITKVKDLISMAQAVADTSVESLKTFGESLKSFGKNAVKGFVEQFSGTTPKDDAKKAVTAMVQAGIDGAEKKKDDVKKKFQSVAKAAIDALSDNSYITDAKTAGENIAKGFSSGIDAKVESVATAAANMVKAAIQAAKEAADENSPSKEFYKIGDFAGIGFVNALNDNQTTAYSAGYTMADLAKQGLSKAITKVSDLINDGIDTQPTIRPVLDLSNVKSGAGYLSSMFNNGPSVGVTSNLRAISYGVNSRLQNGVNDDVISAIDGLRKDLGNVRGDTYSINGITYDDGSNITDAVRTIIRAVKVEGRV